MDAIKSTRFTSDWMLDDTTDASPAPVVPVTNITPPSALRELAEFGFSQKPDGSYVLPEGVITLQADGEQAQESLIDVLKTMGVPPLLGMTSGERYQAVYSVADLGSIDALAHYIPEGVLLIRAGEPIDVSAFDADKHLAKSIAELSELTGADIRMLGRPTPEPVITSNPLLPYSLRGQSEKFRRMAVEARPLLGEVCLRGQVTIWYAAPGTGKTLVALSLLVDAIGAGRVPAENVFYVNADDNGQGFATKLQIMDDVGGNTLAPGFRGFRAPELNALLHAMANRDEARGALIIIDTIKKFASLMDKRESSEFAHACRRVAMMGGTVLGLAHTTKNSNADGTPRYAGTSDLVDDADAAYTLKLLSGSGDVTEKVVEFTCFKSRGDCAETAAYAFAAGRGVGYDEKLASVRLIDPTQLDEFQRVEAERSDADIIEAVAGCIGEGINTKMLLAKEVAVRAKISGRAAGRLIEKYTGDDPAKHRWRFDVGERGAQTFTLLRLPALTA